MVSSIFKRQLPPDLINQYMIALHADLRGSTQTKKYKESDPEKYPLLKEKFKKIANSLKDKARSIFTSKDEEGKSKLYYRVAEEGDNLEVAFYNPWPDIAIFCALNFALSLHQKVLKHDFNSHGVAVGIHLGGVKMKKDISRIEPLSFTRASRMSAYVKKLYRPPSYETKIFISKDVYDFLGLDYQQYFKLLGKHNIAKERAVEQMKMELFEFQNDNAIPVATNLESFFESGLVGVLPEGLCPSMSRSSKGHQGFLNYLVDSTHREIRILQTFIPYIDDLRMHFKNALRRNVEVQVLLLNPYMSPEFANIFGVSKKKFPPIFKQPCSPLAFQRGLDLGFEPPLEFNTEIIKCQTALSDIMVDLNLSEIHKPYDATPSACLHLFDDMLFVGNFLQKSFAVATPHLVVIKGSELFDKYKGELDKLWNQARAK